MCRAVPLALQCRLLFTICPWQKEYQKHPKYHIFSVISVPVWRTRPKKDSHFPKPTVRELRSNHKKGRFHETPVKIVQNVHRFTSCAFGQVMVHFSSLCSWSTKAKNMTENTVSLLLASLCVKDLEPRWYAPWYNCKRSHALSHK